MSHLLRTCLALGVLFALSGPVVAAPDGEPAIELLNPVIDFGTVEHGVVVERTFRFKNAGTAELRLLGVDTSCGCTAALPSKLELAPGEEAELSVAFTTREKRLTSDADVLTNTIELTTNDPRHLEGGKGKAFFRLVGTVNRVHRYVPAEGPKIIARKGETTPTAARARIYPKNGDFTMLIGAQVTQVPFGLKVVDQKIITKDGKPVGIEVAVIATPDADAGTIDGSITIEPADRKHAAVYLQVKGNVEPAVAPSPTRLTLSGDDAEDVAWIALNAEDPASVRVLSVAVVMANGAKDAIDVAVEPSLSGAVSPRIRVARKSNVKTGSGEIVCRLTSRFSPVVRIPFDVVSPSLDQARYERELAAKLRLSTDVVDLGAIQPNHTWNGLFTVTAAGEPVKLTDLEVVGNPRVSVESDTVREGKVERVTIRVDAGGAETIEATVRFRPRPGAPVLEMPVRAQVQGPLIVSPEAAFLSADGSVSTIVIRRRNKHPLEITGITDLGDQVDYRVNPGKGDRVRVQIKRKKGETGTLNGSLIIETNVEGAEVIRIPLFAE